jgi:hypothetical protein
VYIDGRVVWFLVIRQPWRIIFLQSFHHREILGQRPRLHHAAPPTPLSPLRPNSTFSTFSPPSVFLIALPYLTANERSGSGSCKLELNGQVREGAGSPGFQGVRSEMFDVAKWLYYWLQHELGLVSLQVGDQCNELYRCSSEIRIASRTAVDSETSYNASRTSGGKPVS